MVCQRSQMHNKKSKLCVLIRRRTIFHRKWRIDVRRRTIFRSRLYVDVRRRTIIRWKWCTNVRRRTTFYRKWIVNVHRCTLFYGRRSTYVHRHTTFSNKWSAYVRRRSISFWSTIPCKKSCKMWFDATKNKGCSRYLSLYAGSVSVPCSWSVVEISNLECITIIFERRDIAGCRAFVLSFQFFQNKAKIQTMSRIKNIF